MTPADQTKEQGKRLRTLAESALLFMAAPTQRSAEELLHRSFLARVHAGDQPRWVALLARMETGDANGSADLALQRGNGTAFQAQLAVVKQEVGAGDTAIRIALTDISRRKAAEAAQAQQINELERFNRVAVDRELVTIGLKRQVNVNALSRELGRAPPFALDFVDAPDATGDAPQDSSLPVDQAGPVKRSTQS